LYNFWRKRSEHQQSSTTANSTSFPLCIYYTTSITLHLIYQFHERTLYMHVPTHNRQTYSSQHCTSQ
jgi:hypothetical protein